MESTRLSVTCFTFCFNRILFFILPVIVVSIISSTFPANAGSAWDSYSEGLRAMEAGDCIAAKKYFNDAIAKDPQDRKIRRGMFFDYYQPNAKLEELGPCAQQGEKNATQPLQIVLFAPTAESTEFSYQDKSVKVKWRVTGGSGKYSVTVDGNPVLANAEGLYTSSLTLDPGENTYILSAYDKKQNTVQSTKLKLTRLPPPPLEIAFLTPSSLNAEYPYEDESAEVKWTISGGSGQFIVTVDGNPVQKNPEGIYTSTLSLNPGINTFNISIFDKEHNKVEATSLQLKRLPPPLLKIALISPSSDGTEYPFDNENIIAKWRVTGGSGQYLVTMDGNPVTVNEDGFYASKLALKPGVNTFNLSVFDKKHNKIETAKLNLKRRPPPPMKVALISPTSSGTAYPFENETVEAKWLVSGGSGQFSVTLDGTPLKADADGFYATLLSLGLGENTYTLSVVDKKHNTVESTELVLKRLAPPPLKIQLLNPIAATAKYPYEHDHVELKWRLTGGSGQATVTVNGTPAPPGSSDIYSFSVPIKKGENIVDVLAFDNKLGPEKSEKIRLTLTRQDPPQLELYVDNNLQGTRTNKDAIIVQGKVGGIIGEGNLTVNGNPIKLMGDGRFEHLTPLAVGDNNLQIRLEDGLKRVRTASVKVKRTRNPLAGVDVGNFYALLIANNDYQDPQINKLETPVNDARAIAAILKENYGFNVKVLENATRQEIIMAFNDFRQILTENDNFLVYYAGHGFMDKAEDEGYWLPVDAKKEIDDKWIPNSTISNKMRAVKAKHVLLVTDSCYSGTLTKTRDLAVRKKGEGYLKEIVEKKSRLVMTSGGEEPVADDGGRQGHSVFASGFLKEIEDNDSILESADLYMNVKKYVRNAKDQIPAYSPLPKTGHELGGDFLFIRKK